MGDSGDGHWGLGVEAEVTPGPVYLFTGVAGETRYGLASASWSIGVGVHRVLMLLPMSVS